MSIYILFVIQLFSIGMTVIQGIHTSSVMEYSIITALISVAMVYGMFVGIYSSFLYVKEKGSTGIVIAFITIPIRIWLAIILAYPLMVLQLLYLFTGNRMIPNSIIKMWKLPKRVNQYTDEDTLKFYNRFVNRMVITGCFMTVVVFVGILFSTLLGLYVSSILAVIVIVVTCILAFVGYIVLNRILLGTVANDAADYLFSTCNSKSLLLMYEKLHQQYPMNINFSALYYNMLRIDNTDEYVIREILDKHYKDAKMIEYQKLQAVILNDKQQMLELNIKDIESLKKHNKNNDYTANINQLQMEILFYQEKYHEVLEYARNIQVDELYWKVKMSLIVGETFQSINEYHYAKEHFQYVVSSGGYLRIVVEAREHLQEIQKYL